MYAVHDAGEPGTLLLVGVDEVHGVAVAADVLGVHLQERRRPLHDVTCPTDSVRSERSVGISPHPSDRYFAVSSAYK